MRAIIQRVRNAHIRIDHAEEKSIGKGMLVFLGIEASDNNEDIDWLSGKISRLRIFPDNHGIMNLSIRDINGEVMIVSQFTLHASTKKGNRPSYIKAAPPQFAIPVYEQFISKIGEELNRNVVTGKFGAYMEVSLLNDGPVTIFIDTKNRE